MAIDVNLRDIQSGFLTATAYTENNTLIEEALQKALNREGGANNEMLADLDMGLKNINNLKEAFLQHQAVNFGQAQAILSASSTQVVSTTDIEKFTATAGQTLFTFQNIQYVQGVNALIVFVDGLYQRAGASEDYEETSTTSITFNSALAGGEEVTILGARFNAEVFAEEASGSASDAADSAEEAEHWANFPEDQLVPEGDGVDDYSALHWANKSEGFATDAEDAAGYKLGINNQSGTSYTLVLSDEGDLIRMTNSGANTVTVPTNASVAFEVGTIVNVRQSGSGTTTISPASGVTINAPQDEFTTDGEEFGVALVKVATDEWDLVKSYAGVRNDAFGNDITAAEGTSGYQDFPSGLIFQWGKESVSYFQDLPDTPTTVTYPKAFPTSVINVSVTKVIADSYITDGVIETDTGVKNVGNTTFDIYQMDTGDREGAPSATVDVYWFAIGA